MQIEFNNAIQLDPRNAPQGIEKNIPQSQKAAQNTESADFSSFEAILNQAMNTEYRTQNLEQIRLELESGQLDTPEAARAAAENMLINGI